MKQHKNNKRRKREVGHPEEIKNQYLQDLQDWADNRYNPGFYTEGHIPPEIKYSKRPVGVLILFFGLLTLILGYGIRLKGNTLFALVAFIAAILQIVAGVMIVFKINKT